MAAFDIIENDMFDSVVTEEPKKIDTTKAQALEKAISNKNIPNDKVVAVLNKCGYKSISDILVGDYKRVCDAISEEVK